MLRMGKSSILMSVIITFLILHRAEQRALIEQTIDGKSAMSIENFNNTKLRNSSMHYFDEQHEIKKNQQNVHHQQSNLKFNNHFTNNSFYNELRIRELMKELILKSRMANKTENSTKNQQIVQREKQFENEKKKTLRINANEKENKNGDENENGNSSQQLIKAKIKNSINNAKNQTEANYTAAQQSINNDMPNRFLNDAANSFKSHPLSTMAPPQSGKSHNKNNSNELKRFHFESFNEEKKVQQLESAEGTSMKMDTKKIINGMLEKRNDSNYSEKKYHFPENASVSKTIKNSQKIFVFERTIFKTTTWKIEKLKSLTDSSASKVKTIQQPNASVSILNDTEPSLQLNSSQNMSSNSSKRNNSNYLNRNTNTSLNNSAQILRLNMTKTKSVHLEKNTIPMPVNISQSVLVIDGQEYFDTLSIPVAKPSTIRPVALNASHNEFPDNGKLKNETAIDESAIVLFSKDKSQFNEEIKTRTNEQSASAYGATEVDGQSTEDELAPLKLLPGFHGYSNKINVLRPVKCNIDNESNNSNLANIKKSNSQPILTTNPTIRHRPKGKVIHEEIIKTVNCYRNLESRSKEKNSLLEKDDNQTTKKLIIKIFPEKLIIVNINAAFDKQPPDHHKHNVQLNGTTIISTADGNDSLKWRLNNVEVTRQNVVVDGGGGSGDDNNTRTANKNYGDDSDEENYDDMDIFIERRTTTEKPSIEITIAAIVERNQLLKDIGSLTNKTYSTPKDNCNSNKNRVQKVEDKKNDDDNLEQQQEQPKNDAEKAEATKISLRENESNSSSIAETAESKSKNNDNPNETTNENSSHHHFVADADHQQRNATKVKRHENSTEEAPTTHDTTSHTNSNIALQSMSTIFSNYGGVGSKPTLSAKSQNGIEEEYLITTSIPENEQSFSSSSEIVATNWWHTLSYAEIRKFLNTIFDSERVSKLYAEISRKLKETDIGQRIKEMIQPSTVSFERKDDRNHHDGWKFWNMLLADFWSLF